MIAAAGVGTCTGLQGHRNVDSSLRTLNLVLDATGFLLSECNTFSAACSVCDTVRVDDCHWRVTDIHFDVPTS